MTALHHADKLASELLRSQSDEEVIGLIEAEIEVDTDLCSVEDARTVDGAVPVWAIVSHLQAVNGDVEQAAADYGIRTDAIRASVAFYQRNREMIGARILANVDEASTFAFP